MSDFEVWRLTWGFTYKSNSVWYKVREDGGPDELYDIIESCSGGPYLEVFARFGRPGWSQWGNEDVEQNSSAGVAQRKGHTDPQLRPAKAPAGYRGITEGR